MKEIWKDIKGYEGIYQISNYGEVKSLKRKTNNQFGKKDIILKYTIDKDGYKQVVLSKNGATKTIKIHKLVALAFIENTYNLSCINHKDENKTNNKVNNLEWCTVQYNNNYGTVRKRAGEKKSKKVMCLETGKIYKNAKAGAIETHCHRAHITDCCNKKRKTTNKLHWAYFKET